MFDYDKDAYKAVSVLDEYDLLPVLKDCIQKKTTQLYDVGLSIIKQYLELEASLDCLTPDEQIEYLEKRYPCRFREEMSVTYYLSHVGDVST